MTGTRSTTAVPQKGGVGTGTSWVSSWRRRRISSCSTGRRIEGWAPSAASSVRGRLLLRAALLPPAGGAIGLVGAGHDLVHERQPVEGIAGIGDRRLAIGLEAVLLDIGAGEGGTAQEHRRAQALTRHLLQVLAHDHGRLHQQARHADRVGAVGLSRLQDRGQRLLDAEIDDPVAVVGEDDVDQVLADVVDVAFHRGQHDGALLRALDPLHQGLEIGHRLLHRLRRLEDEGQLHLAAEQLAHGLHPVEQQRVDDVERAVPLQRLLELGFQALLVAVHDPQLQTLLDRFGPGPLGRGLGLAIGEGR